MDRSKDATNTTSQSVEDEVNLSFQAYRSLWNSRAQLLSKVTLILSTMSDVSAAFSTGDKATIRDTAGELWSRISDSNAIFLVTDPTGGVIASLGGRPDASLPGRLEVVEQAASRFPGRLPASWHGPEPLPHHHHSGLHLRHRGTALLNVLVAGYDVDGLVAQH